MLKYLRSLKIQNLLLFIVLILILYKFLLAIIFPVNLINSIIYISLFTVATLITIKKLKYFLENGKIRLIDLLILSCFFLLNINLIISLLTKENIPIKLMAISYAIFLFQLLVIYIFFNLNISTLNNISNKLKIFIIPFIIFAIFELIIPKELKLQIGSYMLEARFGIEKIPESYFFREFDVPFLRVGSLLFEPITFGFVILSVVSLYFYQKKQTFLKLTSTFVLLTTLSKSAIITFLFGLTSKLFKKYFFLLYVPTLIVSLIILIIYWNSLSIYIIKISQSVFNHFMGLYYGIINSINSPIMGNGLGTSGYLVYLETKRSGIDHIFQDIPMLHGNESAFGITFYQLGFIYGILYLLTLLYINYKLFKRGLYFHGGIFSGFILSSFITETVTSNLIYYIFMLVTAFIYMNYKKTHFS